jgi:Arc/MetJ-type ribon-helix-helix transcriptional regulator
MPTVTVKLPETLSRSLDHEARRRGVPKSEVIRESLERTLAESRVKGEGPSCLDLVADLVGIFDGPADLSSNKKYLMEALDWRYERDQRKADR